VKVDCATLPSHLIESELFGHEKGAFTGATSKQIGRFEVADGATIFLDEIGELPLELQSKLLRVLQEGKFERLGNPHTITVDVRVIAATNRDLEEETRKGRFRQDLYYRLNVYPISIPPLRKRKDDIPLLVRSFVHKFSKKLGKPIESIPQSTMDTLYQYFWPGNVRELENMIERAVINARNKALRVELPENLASPIDTDKTLEVDVYKTLAEVEREYILRILTKTNWRIAGPDGAATILEINPSTLRSRMQKLGIKK
jgi:chemotaxis protein methyltransferase CheR